MPSAMWKVPPQAGRKEKQSECQSRDRMQDTVRWRRKNREELLAASKDILFPIPIKKKKIHVIYHKEKILKTENCKPQDMVDQKEPRQFLFQSLFSLWTVTLCNKRHILIPKPLSISAQDDFQHWPWTEGSIPAFPSQENTEMHTQIF